jgi:4-deoxy-L-threo-5-hexosulose-uronate ketol-isomerase
VSEAIRYLPTAAHARTLDGAALRQAFLVADLFRPGEVVLRPLDLDRAVLGGAVPTDAPLRLEPIPHLRAEYFCERREAGVLNVGGAGRVTVDGAEHALDRLDVLYVGRGSRDVTFASDDAARPARFYLVSYPAHAAHRTTRVGAADAQGATIGSAERANRRTVYRYVHQAGARSAQLVMGVTVLESGSVWNTMPPHTHARRSEVYLYFDVPADAVVFHLLGEPDEVRTVVARDGEVALSPGWSIHSGCGTASYAFCWAMGGENQDYADMDPVDMATLG